MDSDRGQELEHPVRAPSLSRSCPRRAGLSLLLDTVDKDAASRRGIRNRNFIWKKSPPARVLLALWIAEILPRGLEG